LVARAVGLVALGCSSIPQQSLEQTGTCPIGAVPAAGSVAKVPNQTPIDCAEFANPHDPSPALQQAPIGWASMDADGQNGTTGGRGGELVLARTIQELISYAARPEPLVIEVCGTLGTGVEEVSVASHKTLIGVGTLPTLLGGIDIRDVQNVVIMNLFIRGANPDGIGMRRTHHAWIDHVDISDSSDGNLDVTDQSNYVTISFSKFGYSTLTQEHRFSNLIGSGDDNYEDRGLLKVTLHHNWWTDNVRERMPRARFGDIHLFNNYYSSRGNNYCVQAGVESRLLVEGNYFARVSDPLVLGGGDLLERGNIFDYTSGPISSSGVAFEPPYAVTVDPVCEVPDRVMRGAGPD
jgi:pectate lyase